MNSLWQYIIISKTKSLDYTKWYWWQSHLFHHRNWKKCPSTHRVIAQIKGNRKRNEDDMYLKWTHCTLLQITRWTSSLFIQSMPSNLGWDPLPNVHHKGQIANFNIPHPLHIFSLSQTGPITNSYPLPENRHIGAPLGTAACFGIVEPSPST